MLINIASYSKEVLKELKMAEVATLRILAVNFIGLVITTVIFILHRYFISPVHVVFSCNDDRLMKPLHPHERNISTMTRSVTALAVVIVIIVVDISTYWCSPREGNKSNDEDIVLSIGKIKIKAWVTRLCNRVIIAICGFLLNEFMLNLMKCSVGELRPNFLTQCQPDYNKANCSAGYVTSEICMQHVPDAERFSFPSGVAQASFYGATVIVLYIHYTIYSRKFVLILTLIELIPITLALVYSCYMITIYLHFWYDVLAGLIFGVLFGWLTIRILLNLPEDEQDVQHARYHQQLLLQQIDYKASLDYEFEKTLNEQLKSLLGNK